MPIALNDSDSLIVPFTIILVILRNIYNIIIVGRVRSCTTRCAKSSATPHRLP